MHKIIETRNGKETIKMVDSLKECRKKIKLLRDGCRGVKVQFKIEPASDEDVKFKAKKSQHWGSGQTKLPKIVP